MIEELYINDNYIELSESAKIGLTLQVNDIADLSIRRGNFSNEFVVPKTKNNQIALEFLSGLNSSSLVPYSNNTVRYLQNGITIVNDGVAVVGSYDGYYKIQVLSGNSSPFELISEKTLQDLDFSEYENVLSGLWNLPNVLVANNADGTPANGLIIYPIINYNGASATVRQIDVRRLMKATFAISLFDKIFENIGYTYSGAFTTGDFQNLIVPLYTDNGTADFITTIDAPFNNTPDTSSLTFIEIGALFAKTIDVNNNWRYGNLISVIGGGFSQGWQFVADVSALHNIVASLVYTSTGTGTFTIRVSSVSGISGVYIPLPIIIDTVVNAGSSGTISINEDYYLEAGKVFAITVIASNASDTITFTTASTLTVTRPQLSSSVIFGNIFPVSINLPKIKQIEFIKIICQLYCLTCQTNKFTKNIEFNSFGEIKANIPIAKDWSNKMDISQPFSIEYTIGNYAQENLFQYKEDDSVNNGQLVYSGSLNVNNETLDVSKVAVKLPFAETEMSTLLNGLDVPYINKYDIITDSFKLKTEPRLLYLDKQTLASPLTYIDGSTSSAETNNIPLCYFALPNRSNLGWNNNLLENNYSELQGVLSNVKKLTGYFKLNITDISELNFLIPIFLDVQTPKMQINGYFYLNKVNNYVAGKLTQCELIRL